MRTQQFKLFIATALITFAIGCAVLLMVGCASTPPTPFKTGEEVRPPQGCIEYRERGGEC